MTMPAARGGPPAASSATSERTFVFHPDAGIMTSRRLDLTLIQGAFNATARLFRPHPLGERSAPRVLRTASVSELDLSA
jgi:hypothetical protein